MVNKMTPHPSKPEKEKGMAVSKSFVPATMLAPDVVRATVKDALFDCGFCGYRISDVQMNAFRFDYGCPRKIDGRPCGNSFSNFSLVPETLTPKGRKA